MKTFGLVALNYRHEHVVLGQVLGEVGRVKPCEGVCERQLPRDVRGSFGSYSTRAIRTARQQADKEVFAIGLVAGFQEAGVAATLHAVGGDDGEELKGGFL